MEAVELVRFGLEGLERVERPRPVAGPGEVLLRMRAASLNYRDLLMVQGSYNPRQPLPLVPLSDGVGEVVGLGEGVESSWLGRRVCPIFAQGWWSGEPTAAKLRTTLGGPLPGVLREYVAAPVSGVVEAPGHLSDAAAATLPCAALTAWSALVEQGGLKAGQVVLVQGTGGVSIFALQLARLMGARVIVTSSSDAKLARALALGAEAGINYREVPRWGREARRLAGGEGVDLVVEVGGAGTLEESLQAVRPGGTIAVIGVLGGVKPSLELLPILMRNVRLQGVLVGHREGFERMVQAISAGRLEPVVDQLLPWWEVGEGLRRLASGGHVGKIALRFDGASG